MSTFCRHNRFTADCPICSRGTVLETGLPTRRRRAASGARSKPAKAVRPTFSGPYAAGPARRDEDNVLVTIRLERVPGGVRLGEWAGASLRPRAPVLPGHVLVEIVGRAHEALDARDAAALAEAVACPPVPGSGDGPGVSRGRSGDFKEELRVEALEEGDVRVARWVLRPAVGWELQDAPPMLPASRYAEALAAAARQGLLVSPSADAGSSDPA